MNSQRAGHSGSAGGFPWATVSLAVVITFSLTSLGWVLFGYHTISEIGAYVEPPFDVEVECPEVVQLGETFVIHASVQNKSDQEQVWTTLDVYDSFLQHFRLVGAEPEIITRKHRYDYTVLQFQQTLAPGASSKVSLTLRANKPGVYGSDFDFCDPDENYTSAYAEIVVEAGE